jgi:glyoxylase-like metal-dependent hydrolase (beta-lactamase superfamily II)
VRGGDEITIAGITFDVIDVPGHSAGHVAFAVGDTIFSGDLLFAGSVGRVDLPGGDWETLLASVKRLLDRFGPDAVVYSGHGPQTTLGQELETNPFLGELRSATR